MPGGTGIDLAYQRIEFRGASSPTADNEALTFGGGVHLAGSR